MKKLFILTIAITASLLFVQCKKTEVLTEEIITTEKSLTGNVLEGSNWEVLSVVSVPKNVNINFTVKHPKMNFYNDYIEMKLGRDICSKHYLLQLTISLLISQLAASQIQIINNCLICWKEISSTLSLTMEMK